MVTEQINRVLKPEVISRPVSMASSPSPRFCERKLILALLDLILLNAAYLGALLLRPDLGSSLYVLASNLHWFVILTAIWLVITLGLGCYNLTYAASIPHSLGRVTGAILTTFFIYLMIPTITPALPARRLQMIAFPFFAVVMIGAWRLIYASVFVHLETFSQTALVVGAGWAGRSLVVALNDMVRHHRKPHHSIGYHVVGFVDDDDAKREMTIEGYPVLGGHDDLVRLAHDMRVDEIVVAITSTETMRDEMFEAILQCREMGISITTMTKLYEQMTGRVPVEHAGRDLYVAVPLGRNALHRLYLMVQRIMDICGSLLGCIVLLVAIPVIWLANRFNSPGPLFYSQSRVGKGGKIFSIYKFRSMVVEAEKHTGAVWAIDQDPRITPLGRFLRKTRLDEIPQFLNVLKGDMSLVGPRPERPHFVDQLARTTPFYRVRHAVKPGVTGWTQVMCYYGASVEDQVFRLQHDLYYIKHQNPLLDLEILLKTIPVMIGLKGR